MDPNEPPEGFRRDYQGASAPLDLIALRFWLERIITDYRELIGPQGRHRRPGPHREPAHGTAAVQGKHRLLVLETVRGNLTHPECEEGKRALRSLAAGGIVAYLGRAPRTPSERVPEAVLLDLVVFAMWPIVTAEYLPEHWQESLAELTSPRLAALVDEARLSRGDGDPHAAETFARAVANRSFARSVLVLCDDLADPGRGAPVLTALTVAADVPQPKRKDAAGLLRWALGIGTGVVVGIAVPHGDELAGFIERLIEEIRPEGSGGGSPADGGQDGEGREHSDGDEGGSDDAGDDGRDAGHDSGEDNGGDSGGD
ncbi:hypothetical protein O1R50_05255 [Glycomyces luteolus]|uniref:Uncharacterized protein n=1 Tax=Glycomyces luteolus TaxID=2670330 RepID=A0A9X3P8Q5_9ACTN|nr:hypothetical protein [Glycomyces luteolus]MDA1359018.1 hypothetical protein [Glycomyces luteolus]